MDIFPIKTHSPVLILLRVCRAFFSTIFTAFVPHCHLRCTHCIVPMSLLSHPNSFCGGMSKLKAKFDANLLLYSFSYFGCNSHTVYLLTQWRLLPPLTSTVKSSVFTLALAARVHQCCTNHSCYIDSGRIFSGQTSCVCVCVCVCVCILVNGWPTGALHTF